MITVECSTEGCENVGVEVQISDVNGFHPPVVCGVCGTQLYEGDAL